MREGGRKKREFTFKAFGEGEVGERGVRREVELSLGDVEVAGVVAEEAFGIISTKGKK